jgi:restriction endonuclease S subunit
MSCWISCSLVNHSRRKRARSGSRVSKDAAQATFERADYYVGDVPFVKTAEIANCHIRKTEVSISEQAVRDYNLKLYPVGSVFMAMYGQGKTRGQVALLEIAATTTQNTAAIVPDEEVDSEFLWQSLMSQYERLRDAGSQGHISHLNLGYVKAYPCVLPPFEEQRTIAAILRACDEKIAALEREAAILDELFKALLEELMTGKRRVAVGEEV